MYLGNVNDSIDLCLDSEILNSLLPRCKRFVKNYIKKRI